jgi:hypothetical protein
MQIDLESYPTRFATNLFLIQFRSKVLRGQVFLHGTTDDGALDLFIFPTCKSFKRVVVLSSGWFC